VGAATRAGARGYTKRKLFGVLIPRVFETAREESRLPAQFLITMKNDHSFTFTAAVILAGVVLAFVNPADANNSAPAVASAIKAPVHLPGKAGVVAAVDAPAAPSAKGEAKHKGSCERAKRSDPRA
jgi:hypothetical protein